MAWFKWLKWFQETGVQKQNESQSVNSSEVIPGGILITELLWHIEEQERLARQLELENILAYSTIGLRWYQNYPRLQTPIASSELHQLERLCGQIPPLHTSSVLSRFRQVLATNDARPWELATILKQILIDVLSRRDVEGDISVPQIKQMEGWTYQHKIKHGFIKTTESNCGQSQREEIPTISGYVDRAMQHSCAYTPNRTWNLPYNHPHP